MLCKLLLNNKDVKPAHAVGIIPHIADFHDPQVVELANRIPNSIIVNLACPDTTKTTAMIAGCESVVSSSLHGLIAADSFGIPRLRMRISNRIEGEDHKFNDFDLSVGLSTSIASDPKLLNGKNLQFHLVKPDDAVVSKLKRDLLTAFTRIGL